MIDLKSKLRELRELIFNNKSRLDNLVLTDNNYTDEDKARVWNIPDSVCANGADYGEVGTWADGNPDAENRLYRFVTVVSNGREIAIADSNDQIAGVTTDRTGFVGNAKSYDPADISKSIVGIIGVVPVRTLDSTIKVNDRVMSDDDGYAVKSTNNLGYRVIQVLEAGLLEIVVSVNTDMVQRIKTDMEAVRESIPSKVSELENDKGYLTEHQSLDGYATESWVEGKGYLTEHQDISGKADESELADKLTKPSSGIEVGKYFRVASIDAEGNPVLEAVDLPAPTGYNGIPGIVNTWGDYGLSLAGYRIQVNPADHAVIDAKMSSHRPIVPSRLDYAIRAGLLSNSQITDADKPLICQTIGAERKGKYELLAEVVSDGSYQTIPFAPCTDVFVEMAFPANTSCGSGTLIFNRNNSWVSNQANAQISLGAVTSANYVKKGNTRAFLRNGYWTYEHISPGGGGSAPVNIPAYDNYLVASEVNLPCCRSILINVADFPKGVTIKVWGVQTTDN